MLVSAPDAWGADPEATKDFVRATALGAIDTFIQKPVVEPDEQFHLAIAEFLEDWARTHRPRFALIQIVGDRWSEMPSLARLGVMRLFYLSDVGGLPPQARAEERVIHSTAGDNRGSRDEFAAIPAALQQARALESLGDKPLAIVTAGSEAQDGWLPLQDEMAALSTRSVHHVLPDATHASLIDDERDAAVSSQAILNVVDAVRSTSAR